MTRVSYGNDLRRAWFESTFGDADQHHSAFQAFVDRYSAGNDPAVATRDWHVFRAGWNARAWCE